MEVLVTAIVLAVWIILTTRRFEEYDRRIKQLERHN